MARVMARVNAIKILSLIYFRAMSKEQIANKLKYVCSGSLSAAGTQNLV